VGAEVTEAHILTGEEQIRLAQLQADAETTRADNENKFKLARTEARVKASIAITSGVIVVTIIVALVLLTLQDKKAPDSIGPILPMLIGLMSGVAIANNQRSTK
jgi:pantothenate kinase